MSAENDRSELVAIATNALAALSDCCRAALVAGYFQRRESAAPEAKAALHDAAWSFRRQLGDADL